MHEPYVASVPIFHRSLANHTFLSNDLDTLRECFLPQLQHARCFVLVQAAAGQRSQDFSASNHRPRIAKLRYFILAKSAQFYHSSSPPITRTPGLDMLSTSTKFVPLACPCRFHHPPGRCYWTTTPTWAQAKPKAPCTFRTKAVQSNGVSVYSNTRCEADRSGDGIGVLFQDRSSCLYPPNVTTSTFYVQCPF
jgi:hypothetical protein